MRYWSLFLVLIVSSPSSSAAQSPSPIASYTVHAQKERRNGFSFGSITLPSSELAITAKNDLLILIPQEDSKWVLKRLVGWETTGPREQTLEVLGEVDHRAYVSIETDLTPSPDGKYLVVRINYRSGAIGSSERNRKAVIIVVDLSTFSILSRQMTTDPLLADSKWSFNEHGELVTLGLATRSTHVTPLLRTVTDGYKAAVLSLPDLAATTRCDYDSVTELHSGSSGWTKPAAKSVGDSCAALLTAANVSSVEDLPGNPHGVGERMNFALGCQLIDANEKRKLDLVECRDGRSYADGEFVTTSSHVIKVRSVPENKTVLSIALPKNWRGVSGVLATLGDQDYLVLVREGIRVEVYRLP